MPDKRNEVSLKMYLLSQHYALCYCDPKMPKIMLAKSVQVSIHCYDKACHYFAYVTDFD